MAINVMEKNRSRKGNSEWESEWNCYLLIKGMGKEVFSDKCHLNKDLKKKGGRAI